MKKVRFWGMAAFYKTFHQVWSDEKTTFLRWVMMTFPCLARVLSMHYSGSRVSADGFSKTQFTPDQFLQMIFVSQ